MDIQTVQLDSSLADEKQELDALGLGLFEDGLQ